MRLKIFVPALTVTLVLTGVVSAVQLAMLVELKPLRAVDGGVLTEVVVRVAPEDRAALGKDVMLWVDLSRKEVRVLRRGWALKIDDPTEPLGVEIVIPDGPHVLRVDLEGASGRSTGVWWGDVDVSAPSPVPSPVPVPDETSVSEQRQQKEAATAPAAATATAAGAAVLAAAPDSEPTPIPTEPPEPDPVPTVSPTPTPNPAPAVSEPVDPEIHEVSIPTPVPQADHGGPSDTGELTIVVTRDDQPVTGLVANHFEIEIGGAPVPTTFVEGPGEGRVVFGIAVDLHNQSSADVAWIAGMVRRLAERVEHGPSVVFVDNVNRSFHWSNADDVAAKVTAVDAASVDELPALVRSSLARFRFQFGKTVLLLVTDGQGPRVGKAWNEAHRAAAEAGVPILIAGIWNEGFHSGLRKDLRKLAAATGGSIFYVQGSAQAGNLVEKFGAIIEGTYTVRIKAPPGAADAKVVLVGVDAEVRASTAVRWVKRPWKPPEGGAMRGLLAYMADAALFEDCETGQRFPVSMEADYLTAERAYLDARNEPGAPLMATFEGRLEPRPPMEGEGMIEMIVIDRFDAVHPDEDCESVRPVDTGD